MSNYRYERLSAQDNGFLVAETSHTPLHIASVALYEPGELATEEGGVDIRLFKQFIEARLHEIPRYRQKLMWVPVENRPVWVDDPHFSIDYHIRHTALPRPGSIEELKRLTARITTRTLDRSRPLWELWIIEGLEEGRFAAVSKIHHCMIDGVAGAGLVQILHSPSPDVDIPEPMPYMPRPAPSHADLLFDAVERVGSLPLRALRSLRQMDFQSGRVLEDWGSQAKAVGDIALKALAPSSDTPINGSLGPHRRIDWVTLPLDAVKKAGHALDCKLNDIVLATVTGAVRHYLFRRGVDPKKIDFRISAPVNMRSAPGQNSVGNRVSTWLVDLPIGREGAEGWVDGVLATTRELRKGTEARGFDTLMKAAEYVPPSLVALGARAASGPINMIVTNVPGPQFPLYAVGARLIEMQPLVPLLDGTGLGIALFSYDGKLHIGLNADYELVPDLSTFTALFAQSFMEIEDHSRKRIEQLESEKNKKKASSKRATAQKTSQAESTPPGPPVGPRSQRAAPCRKTTSAAGHPDLDSSEAAASP
ncbi:MAG: wax ester/triacylglycerol synthase family O-acyltransferase [Myxococcota bacterium]|nr:wax ester/triacylglycerol synthase family O-acyltransferase [Myxococcota bacterium]